MRRATIVLALAVLLLLAPVVEGQAEGPAPGDEGYTLPWWTVDGGGTTADSGGGYSLVGTAGQADAGVWAGKDYTLAGGFLGGAVFRFRVYLPLVVR